MMKIIDVKGVSYEYNSNQKVVSDIDIHIETNELVGLAGTNGSGKTTLIKLIYGLLKSDKGDITYFNGPLTKANKQHMMYLPSEDNLPLFLTGIEYLKLVHKFYHRKIDKKRLKQFTKYFEMEKSITDLISSFSHGMKKKLHLISGFLIQPKLLIIDETLNGLDFESKEVCKILLKNYANTERSVLICSHDLKFVAEIVDRLYIMENGEKIVDGNLKTDKELVEKQINLLINDKLKLRGVNFENAVNF